MKLITDVHVHAFPDEIADHAIRTLEAETDAVHAHLDGRIGSLLQSMDRAGIDRSVVCSIATRPRQFGSILEWSRSIASERIVPLPSIHPLDPEALSRVDEVADAGFAGIKLHPYYQDFDLEDGQVLPLFERVDERGLIVVCHTGFDIAFPRLRRADPARVARLLERVPGLRFVATHLGGWEDWDEVRRHLLGRPMWMEISYSLEVLDPEDARKLLLSHSPDHLLFGTDSPWQDQSQALLRLRRLGAGDALVEAMLCANPARLLARPEHGSPRDR